MQNVTLYLWVNIELQLKYKGKLDWTSNNGVESMGFRLKKCFLRWVFHRYINMRKTIAEHALAVRKTWTTKNVLDNQIKFEDKELEEFIDEDSQTKIELT